MFKKRLGELNYEVKDLGLIDLAKDVPDDATMVVMLAPTRAAAAGRVGRAVDRYLDKGGRLLVALDPKARAEPRASSRASSASSTTRRPDRRPGVPAAARHAADRRFAITTQFSAHASTTALSRSVDKGLVLIDSGALEDAPFDDQGAQPKKTMTIRSMESSFLDFNDNFTLRRRRREKRQRWNIARGGRGPRSSRTREGKDKDGFRALRVRGCRPVRRRARPERMGRAAVVLVSGPLLDDSVKWLGGEEVFAGEVVSEDDKPIKHTKSQDASVVHADDRRRAAPRPRRSASSGTWARRRKSGKKAEVKP